MNEMVVKNESSALMQIISRAATDPTLDVAKLQALLAVKKEWEADEARKAFEVAMVRFKDQNIAVGKNKHVSFATSRGNTDYNHATLDNVCDLVGSALASVGISHRWETQQLEGGVIRVTCVLTHELGHSTRTSLDAIADDSGGKNRVQAIGSTVTYLQRYTLMAATGTASRDQDDDGAASEPQPAPEWPEELRNAGQAAAEKGVAAYGAWWKSQSMDVRQKYVHSKEHADFKAKASEVAPC
jgi:hypothetical protein